MASLKVLTNLWKAPLQYKLQYCGAPLSELGEARFEIGGAEHHRQADTASGPMSVA